MAYFQTVDKLRILSDAFLHFKHIHRDLLGMLESSYLFNAFDYE